SWGVVIEEQEDHLFQETSSPISEQKITPPEENDSKVKIEDEDKILSSEFNASKPEPVKEGIVEKNLDKLPDVSSILDIADKKPEAEVKKVKESVPEKLIKEINSIKQKKDIQKKEIEDKKSDVSKESQKTAKEITLETLKEELFKEEEEEFGAYTIDSSEDEEDEYNEETQIDFMQSNLSSQEKNIREYTDKTTPVISDSIKTFNVDREELSQYDKKTPKGKAKKQKKLISKKALRNLIILFIVVSISSIAAMVFNPFNNQNNIKVIKKPIKPITPDTSTKPIDKPVYDNGGIDIDISDEINELLDSEIVDEEFWVIEIATYKDKAEAYKTITKVKKLGYKAEIEKIGNKFTVLINHVEAKKTESIMKKLKAAGFNPSKEAEVIF
ncbi:SPOR domain-containing protein, partial [Candidatus Dependentiae bacterium]|nr:SPOR domain-containing protein [Candidatus Dependentiae bacterium]